MLFMFKELKNKTVEVLRTRYIIAFIVMAISIAVSLIFLFPLILMLASGHDSEYYWQLYIIVPTFCLFLLTLFYNRVISKEIKKRIEKDPEKTTEQYSFSWKKILMAAVSSMVIIIIAYIFFSKKVYVLIILVILVIINLLLFYPELREKMIRRDS